MTAPQSREFDIDALTPRLAYKAVVGVSVPRPVAWVTTVSDAGIVNLAPFSFFTPLSYRPATFGISISTLDDGREKDTLRNVRAMREFVINIAGADLAETLHRTGARLPEAVSEAEEYGVALRASSTVRPPRVHTAAASFECTLDSVTPIPGGSHWVVGKSSIVHVRSELVDDELNVDFARLRPLGRLIGTAYQLPGEVARFDV